MSTNWIPEWKAAEMLGYKSTAWFRRLVKAGTLKIHYTHNGTGRKFFYSEKDLQKVQINNSTLVK